MESPERFLLCQIVVDAPIKRFIFINIKCFGPKSLPVKFDSYLSANFCPNIYIYIYFFFFLGAKKRETRKIAK